MRLKDGMMKNDRRVSVQSGDTNDDIDGCVNEVLEYAVVLLPLPLLCVYVVWSKRRGGVDGTVLRVLFS